jgi:PadR family transcriptional regulator, regulatory protein PadR
MRGHGRGLGRGRGRGREGDRSPFGSRLLEPALLVLLSTGEVHGYTLLDRIEGLGFDAPHPSMVYRVLREMEEAGWVTSVWDREQTQGPPRRVYTLSAEGLAALSEWKQILERTQGSISRLLNEINGFERSANDHKEVENAST